MLSCSSVTARRGNLVPPRSLGNIPLKSCVASFCFPETPPAMPFGVAGGFFSPKFFDFRVSSFDDRMSRVDDRTSLVCMIGVSMAGVVLSYRVTLSTAALRPLCI